MYATQTDNSLLSINFDSTSLELKNNLATWYKMYPGTSSLIKPTIHNSFIPEEHLTWISGNRRQLHWIEKYIKKDISTRLSISNFNGIPKNTNPHSKPLSYISIPHFLTGISRGIAMFDYWAAHQYLDINSRITQSRTMQSAWMNQAEVEKSFDWINDEEGPKKINIFRDRLIAKKVSGVFVPDNFNDYEDFLIFLDETSATDFEKITINKEVRNLWNQQKRREINKNIKKQCNFNLPTTIDDKLSKLAKKYNLSRVDVIEILINSESDRQIFINAWLQRKPNQTNI